jgi:hypothetical protein
MDVSRIWQNNFLQTLDFPKNKARLPAPAQANFFLSGKAYQPGRINKAPAGYRPPAALGIQRQIGLQPRCGGGLQLSIR